MLYSCICLPRRNPALLDYVLTTFCHVCLLTGIDKAKHKSKPYCIAYFTKICLFKNCTFVIYWRQYVPDLSSSAVCLSKYKHPSAATLILLSAIIKDLKFFSHWLSINRSFEMLTSLYMHYWINNYYRKKSFIHESGTARKWGCIICAIQFESSAKLRHSKYQTVFSSIYILENILKTNVFYLTYVTFFLSHFEIVDKCPLIVFNIV